MSTVSSKAWFFCSVSYTCHVKNNFLCVAQKLFRVMSSSSKMFNMVDGGSLTVSGGTCLILSGTECSISYMLGYVRR